MLNNIDSMMYLSKSTTLRSDKLSQIRQLKKEFEELEEAERNFIRTSMLSYYSRHYDCPMEMLQEAKNPRDAVLICKAWKRYNDRQT